MIKMIRQRMSGHRRRGSEKTLVRSRVALRIASNNSDSTTITLKGFSTSTGALSWKRRLDNPIVSTDGYIYGYALVEDDSSDARKCTIINLYNLFGGQSLRVARNTAVPRYKKWIRKLNVNGGIVGDSSFFWYTGNSGAAQTPFELPLNTTGFMQDRYTVTADGQMLMVNGNNSSGAFAQGGESLISWDDNNSTTIRKYTIVAAAVRELASPPTDGIKLRFIAENDGTNAEQTIDVTSMHGKTAADLATALEAFPHIVSATGTGGPYPYVNIDLEIEWAQSTTHFKTVRRIESTSRAWRTWLRDWDTGKITAGIDSTSSAADSWVLTTSDNVLGWNSNTAAGVGSPATTGTYFELYSGSAFSWSQSWRVGPTTNRGPLWGGATGQTRVFYDVPTIRNGRIVCGHDTGRANNQGTSDHCFAVELQESDGAIIANRTNGSRWAFRSIFASDDKLLQVGWDSSLLSPYSASAVYDCENAEPDFCTLASAVDGSAIDYRGPYGVKPIAADLTAMYSIDGPFSTNLSSSMNGSGSSSYQQAIISSANNRIMTVMPIYATGGSSRVSPDSYFSLGNYYRIQYTGVSPVNAHWISSGMEWRGAWFATGTITASTSPLFSTDWLDFNADEADFETALLAVVGNNDAGQNAFVETAQYPLTGDDILPQMIWQRGIRITFPSERPNFPVTTPPIPWSLNNRDEMLQFKIQVRAAVANQFTNSPADISRVNWSDGSAVWTTTYGLSVGTGSPLQGQTAILSGTKLIVSGAEVTS